MSCLYSLCLQSRDQMNGRYPTLQLHCVNCQYVYLERFDRQHITGVRTGRTSSHESRKRLKRPRNSSLLVDFTLFTPKEYYLLYKILILILLFSSPTSPVHVPIAATATTYHTKDYYSSTTEQKFARTSSNKRKSSPLSSLNPRTILIEPITDWYATHIRPTMKDWPKVQCRIEPTTTLKIRKTFRPFKTIVRLSAQYNTQIGIWKFHSSWEDTIIGGKFTLAGRKELQFTKSWSLTGGNFLSGSSKKKKNENTASSASTPGETTGASTTNIMDDMVTRLRVRAAVDLQTWKAYVRVGFRTEQQSSPIMMINVMEGFTIVKHIPLDGANGQVKLEVKANFALPEPEIEYSTETHRSLVGMGDIEVGVEELNLLLDY